MAAMGGAKAWLFAFLAAFVAMLYREGTEPSGPPREFQARHRDADAEQIVDEEASALFQSRLRQAGALNVREPTEATVETPVGNDNETGAFTGPWGFDLSGMDDKIEPGRDFFGYANGNWLKRTIIPPNETTWNQHRVMDLQINARLRGLLEQAAKDGTDIGLVYQSLMDEEQVEQLGITPVLPILDRVRQIETLDQFAAFSSRGLGGSPFILDFLPDPKDPEMMVAIMGQGQHVSPSEVYWQPEYAAVKEGYQKHVAKMLGLVGWQDPDQAAADVVAFETRLAKVDAILKDAPVPSCERVTVAELPARFPGFPWEAYIEGRGGAPPSATLLVPAANETARDGLPAVIDVVLSADIGTLRSWTAFYVVVTAAPSLSKAVRDAANEMDNDLQPEPGPKWKQALDKMNELMGDAVGKQYVEQFFPESTRAVMDELTGLLKQAFEQRLRACTWMSDATKKRALSKLAALKFENGRPNKFRDYAAVAPDAKDMFGNLKKAKEVNLNFTWHAFGRPLDHSYWDASIRPQIAGGFYTNPENKAKFTAGFMLPPLFNPVGDMAVNFGAVGGSIGHELTHGFDPKGRMFNEQGHLEDWWTQADSSEFNHRTAEYSKQFANFTLGLPAGMHIRADATKCENVADLGGINIAYDALQLWLRNHTYEPQPPLLGSDGLEADRRFFLGWAQVQREKFTDAGFEKILATSDHSPGVARATIPLQNVDAWYAAFNIKPGDPLYLDKASRIQIY